MEYIRSDFWGQIGKEFIREGLLDTGTIYTFEDICSFLRSRPELKILIAFDEVDYITPSNAGAPQWREGFVEFWRNVRAAFHAAARSERKVSLLVSGVSSRWFSVESIDGVENAALAFIPEEYLSPLPHRAANAMIKKIGAMAGLQFEDAALDAISYFCSDMPFWIRKACSYINRKIEIAIRPITLNESTVVPMLETYGRNEGAAMAMVALQHDSQECKSSKAIIEKLGSHPIRDTIA